MKQAKEVFNKVIDTDTLCYNAYSSMSAAVKRAIKCCGKVEVYFTDTKGKPISGQMLDSKDVYYAYRYLVNSLKDKKHGVMKLRIMEQNGERMADPTRSSHPTFGKHLSASRM